ncbi:MAG: hypothetical protein AAGI45_06230 [Cyanobacteria bacterium P01_H01_bin.26]
MLTIGTADKFLGSLTGAYLGYSYLEHQHGDCASHSNPMYQPWLHQQNIPLGPELSGPCLAVTLPWLLYHHDDSIRRHHWLAHQLASAPSPTASIVDTAIALYILGDSLEWIMQCDPVMRYPLPALCMYLQQQCLAYPASIIPQVNQLIAWLNIQSMEADRQIPDQNQPALDIVLAIHQCLNYRENLALALANPQATHRSMIIGYLLGAWRGISVIPAKWLASLTPDARQSLTQIAQQLYRTWAGVVQGRGSLEISPLNF